MDNAFKEQGGVSEMDPGPLKRWLQSKFLKYISSETRRATQRQKRENARIKAGAPHVVEYFHQVEDGYSHLAAQVLQRLVERYEVDLVCHLVRGPQGDNAAEPDLLLRLSRYDAHQVAAHYGLEFPDHPHSPSDALVQQAQQILAHLDDVSFVANAAAVGAALWSNDGVALQALADHLGLANDAQTQARLDAGTKRRGLLKHYSGAMFYYAGEWYWGVDRLYHLEERLASLQVDRCTGQPLLASRPTVEAGPLHDDAGRLTLEIYPSLRSPYTAISFDRALQLARDTGVNTIVRPVLPMVMRGVPATREKGLYIFTDTQREARAAEVPFGNLYDPIGEPVRRCYSLYPWACERGRGNALLSSFLRAAWVEGVNTNTTRGLRHVVEGAGLDWSEAQLHLGQPGWESLLEDNRKAMYAAGLWGVPSFRLLGDDGQQVLAIWGQDRLWLVSRAIQAFLNR